MKYVLSALPLALLATASVAHQAPTPHHHMSDANWMPLAAGLLAIGAAAAFAWRAK